MEFKNPVCPECGGSAVAILEIVPCLASLDTTDGVTFEYGGDSDMLWDGQRPELIDDKASLRCEEGHAWETEVTELDA